MSTDENTNQKSNIVDRDGEMLFIYDAVSCNPNGDPGDENKPRMDYTTSASLVSDVRLKRYIRDYLELRKNQEIFLTNPGGLVLNATNRLKYWKSIKDNNKIPESIEDFKEVNIKDIKNDDLINAFIDIRMFGCAIPIKSESKKESGRSIKIIGPIQFNWGRSFNQVELIDSQKITSHFSSETGSQGTIGSDFRVYYSLIGFYGIISSLRAKWSKLKWDEVELFDECIIKAIPTCVTRSKIGQRPRLYLRLDYDIPGFHIGDLRRYVKLVNTQDLRNFDDVKFDFTKLKSKLDSISSRIKTIYCYVDEAIKDDFNEVIGTNLKEKMKLLEA